MLSRHLLILAVALLAGRLTAAAAADQPKTELDTQLQEQAARVVTPKRIAEQLGFNWPLQAPELTPAQIATKAAQLATAAARQELPDSLMAEAEAQIKQRIRLREIGEPVSLVIRTGRERGTRVEGKLARTAPGRVYIGSRWVSQGDVSAQDWIQFDPDAVATARAKAIAQAREELHQRRAAYAKQAEPKLLELLYERHGYAQRAGAWVAKTAVVEAEVARRRQQYIAELRPRRLAAAAAEAGAQARPVQAASAAPEIASFVQIDGAPVQLQFAAWTRLPMPMVQSQWSGTRIFGSPFRASLNLQQSHRAQPASLPLAAALPMLHEINGLIVGATPTGRIFVLDINSARGNWDNVSFAKGTILATGRGLDNTLVVAFSGTLADRQPGCFLVRYDPIGRIIAAIHPLQAWQPQRSELDHTIVLERFTIPPPDPATAAPTQTWASLLRQDSQPPAPFDLITLQTDQRPYWAWQARTQLQEVGPNSFWFGGIAFEVNPAEVLVPAFRFPEAAGDAFHDAAHHKAYVVQDQVLYSIDTTTFTVLAAYPARQSAHPSSWQIANAHYVVRLLADNLQVFARHTGQLQSQQQLPQLVADTGVGQRRATPIDLQLAADHVLFTCTATTADAAGFYLMTTASP